MIDSERLDRSSASSAYRRRRCSGSENLIRALREAGKLNEQPPEPDAQSGTLVHAGWCTGSTNGLNPQEAATLAKLQSMEAQAVNGWARSDRYTLLGREQRLWLHQDLEPIHSGQFDVAYGTLTAHRMLIIDGKTLFKEVLPAETNDQLRELVALARYNFPACVEFTVAILQPWVSTEPSVAVYDQTEAELALRLLRQTIADCADSNAPRTPGAWCKYCPANANCEEARTHIGITYNLAKRIESGDFVLPIGEQGARVLDSIETAEITLKALKDAYKEMITHDPEAVPGWYMKAGNQVREISDIKQAYEIALANAELSTEAFLKCTKLSVSALEETIASRLKLRGNERKEIFNRLFDHVIAFKQNAPMLVKESVRKGRHKQLVNGRNDEA